MRICHIQSEEIGDCRQITADVILEKAGTTAMRFWIRYPLIGSGVVIADPFVAAFLVPCMVLGENLHIEAPVSPALRSASDKIQDLVSGWYPKRSKISLTCAGEYTPHATTRKKSGALFSGGVDSWYTALKIKDQIDYLILIKGFDIHSRNREKWDQMRSTAVKEAAQMGKSLLTVETNLASLYPRMKTEWKVNWGGSLAAIGLFLQDELSKFFISSERSVEDLAPSSTHPQLDPLWSTEALQVVHYGSVGRLGKIRYIRDHYPQAFDTLRVCNRHRSKEYNCCKCEKCLRTMAGLRLCGALESAGAFHKPLQLNRFKRVLLRKEAGFFERELLREAKAEGDQELVEVLEIALGLRFSFVSFTVRSLKQLRKKLGGLIRSCCPRLFVFLERFT